MQNNKAFRTFFTLLLAAISALAPSLGRADTDVFACFQKYAQSPNVDVRQGGELLKSAYDDCDYPEVRDASKFIRAALESPNTLDPIYEDPMNCEIHNAVQESIDQYCGKSVKPWTLQRILADLMVIQLPARAERAKTQPRQ